MPVAEAFASKCAVVGYHGLGGKELFQIASLYDLSYEVSFGDWSSFLEGTFYMYSSYMRYPNLFSKNADELSSQIVERYSISAMKDSLQFALNQLMSKSIIP